MKPLHALVRGSLLAVLTLLGACGGLPSGTHIRVASATGDDLERAAHSGQRIYYEFEEGDRVPLLFGVAGVLEAESGPVEVVARRRFAVLVHPNGTMAFILDGRHLTPANVAASWMMLFGPDPSGRAATAIIVGLGDVSNRR